LPIKLTYLLQHIFFVMLEIGDDDEAYDNHTKPRCNLRNTYYIPLVNLVRIFPSAEICRNILSNPNKESYQDKRDIHSERSSDFCDSEVHPSFPKQNEYEGHKNPSQVPDEMMGEKVQIH